MPLLEPFFRERAVPDPITRLNAALEDLYRLASDTGEDGMTTVCRAQMKRAVDGTGR